jgi:predicted RNA-binding protein YlxR (DUF448 family)
MIRLVLGEDGRLFADLAGRAFGRGAWVHPRTECLARAAQGGAAKSFKTRVSASPADVVAEVRAAADRRVEALIGAARGAGRLSAGSDVAREAHESGTAALVIVAGDARAAGTSAFLVSAAAAGKVAVWGTKERLGRAAARAETAVVAIRDAGFATAIMQAIALAALPDPDARAGQSEQVLVEVR